MLEILMAGGWAMLPILICSAIVLEGALGGAGSPARCRRGGGVVYSVCSLR